MFLDPGVDPLDPDRAPPALLEFAASVGMLQCLLHSEAGYLDAILGSTPEPFGQLEDLLSVEPPHPAKPVRLAPLCLLNSLQA